MVVGAIAESLGVREDGFRLFISMFAGYPLAAIHRAYFYKQSPHVQHIFFLTAGILLYIFNYGLTVYHALLSTFFAYLITNFFPGTNHSVIMAHVAFLGHLLVGYVYAESDQYDITWTTPFCIMALRYIGLVMDVYDGHNYETAKPDQKLTGIRDKPSLLEIGAFGFFFAGTFVGHQFSLSRFRQFVNGEFLDENTKEVRTSGLMPSLGRFVAGLTYLALTQWSQVWIPAPEYFHSAEYLNQSFFWRWTWVTIWFRLTMDRYAAAWLITEGAAILAGLGYNGKDKNGEDRWDGVRDLHITGWETGMDFDSVVQSFNVGTNTFAKNHLFRRLRWLNSKMGAHGVTLFYLAIWHGYHLGYFLMFAINFGCFMVQEQFYHLISVTRGARAFLDQKWMYPIKFIFGRIITNYFMAFGFLPFGLIKTTFWWEPVKSLYFIGFILNFFALPLLYQVLLRIVPREPRKTEKSLDSSKSAPVSTTNESKKDL